MNDRSGSHWTDNPEWREKLTALGLLDGEQVWCEVGAHWRDRHEMRPGLHTWCADKKACAEARRAQTARAMAEAEAEDG